MKNTLAAFALVLLSTPALFAAETTIKTCNTTVASLDVEGTFVEMSIVITANDLGEMKALVKSTSAKGTEELVQDVVISEAPVQAGLTMNSDPYLNYNDSERLILHAMMITEDPVMEGRFTSGMDLSKVRSAKVYHIGAAAKFGQAAIVEAKDANNQTLGSFLGGFVVSACK